MSTYFEVHGTGFPTILLHGGIGASECFGAIIPLLAEGRQVIAVHLQGHGRTPDLADRPLRDETLADDVADVAAELGHEQVDVVGYSFGAGVAIQTTVRHPALVRRLVVLSMPVASDAAYPDVRAQFDAMAASADTTGPAVQASPLGEMYPDVDYTALFRKMGEHVARPYDWRAEVAVITAPSLWLMADADYFPPSHYVEVFASLGGGQRDAGIDGTDRPAHRLAVVPGTSHYDVLTATPVTGDLIKAFLDA